MTDSQAGKATSAAAGPNGSAEERVVVRDKRKIDGGAGKAKPGAPAGRRTGAEPPAADVVEAEVVGAEVVGAEVVGAEVVETEAVDGEAVEAEVVEAEVVDGEVVEAEVVEGDRAADAGGPDTGAGSAASVEVEVEVVALGAELEALRTELEERTRDLQRVSAEYANYRKRVERDKGLVADQATGIVLASLLPVLDDLDRAREHGDLVGPFGAVAEQLAAALGKYGLTPFGEKGDAFDPTRHEAVAHLTSADVAEPTCIDVMRRGYLLGDRLLRPALVAVADPE